MATSAKMPRTERDGGGTSECHPLAELKLDKKLADVVLLCDGGALDAHILILSFRSPYFGRMFSSQFKEAKCKQVDFSHVNVELMDSVLDYIYSGSTGKLSQLTLDKVLKVHELSHLFELNSLTQLCWRIIIETLNPDYCVDAWNAALLYGYDVKDVVDTVMGNLKALHEKNKLEELTDGQLKYLMDEIVSNKRAVGSFFLQWLLVCHAKGRISVDELEEFFLSLADVPKEFMIQLLESHESNFSQSFLRRIIERQFLWRMKTDKELEETVSVNQKQASNPKAGVKVFNFQCFQGVFNGCLCNQRAFLEIVDCYSLLQNKQLVEDLPFLFGGEVFTVIQYEKFLYLIGAVAKDAVQKWSSQIFLCYDWETNIVTMQPSLLQPVESPQGQVIGERIYVVSRCREESPVVIQEFNVKEREWKIFNTGISLKITDCLAFGDVLYTFCSNEDSLFMYTFFEGKLEFVCDVPIPSITYTNILPYKENFLFITYYPDDFRQCFKYTPRTAKWKLLKNWNFDRELIQLINTEKGFFLLKKQWRDIHIYIIDENREEPGELYSKVPRQRLEGCRPDKFSHYEKELIYLEE